MNDYIKNIKTEIIKKIILKKFISNCGDMVIIIINVMNQ